LGRELAINKAITKPVAPQRVDRYQARGRKITVFAGAIIVPSFNFPKPLRNIEKGEKKTTNILYNVKDRDKCKGIITLSCIQI